MKDICIRCHQRAKRKGYQFCSQRCTNIAAKNAPQLLRVPKGHVMYNDVKKKFAKNWQSHKRRRPTICRIYLITWTAKMRKSFDKYRATIEKKRKIKPKETKQFRAERRTCRAGDPSQPKFCHRSDCSLCRAIRSGFKTSLERRKKAALGGAKHGVRFGGGIYQAKSSSKAYEYAKNYKAKSPYRVVIVTRTVLGHVQKLHHTEHRRIRPNKGYDSVEGFVGSPEYVVYNTNAVRPAYLLLLK